MLTPHASNRDSLCTWARVMRCSFMQTQCRMVGLSPYPCEDNSSFAIVLQNASSPFNRSWLKDLPGILHPWIRSCLHKLFLRGLRSTLRHLQVYVSCNEVLFWSEYYNNVLPYRTIMIVHKRKIRGIAIHTLFTRVTNSWSCLPANWTWALQVFDSFLF